MNDIFSNLAIRNADRPSPEVLQPRLPSLFEPSISVDGSPESILDQPMSISPKAASRIDAEQPGSSPIDRESPSPSIASVHGGSTTIKTMDQSLTGGSLQPKDSESAGGKTIPLSAHFPLSNILSESIHPSIALTPHEEMHDDLRRSATIMSDDERIPARTSANNPQRESATAGERIVHPRVERVMANKVDQLVMPTRGVPGRTDGSMVAIQPREESSNPEPPVVRIHIGRIDVRAITSPPSQPAPKPAPVQPRLTLDDYLRQREGRR